MQTKQEKKGQPHKRLPFLFWSIPVTHSCDSLSKKGVYTIRPIRGRSKVEQDEHFYP